MEEGGGRGRRVMLMARRRRVGRRKREGTKMSVERVRRRKVSQMTEKNDTILGRWKRGTYVCMTRPKRCESNGRTRNRRSKEDRRRRKCSLS